MKFILFVLLLFTATSIFSQDSLLIKRIDSIVIQINRAKLKAVDDSSNNSEPKVSMEMYSHSTAYFRDNEFVKFFAKDSIKTNTNGTTGVMKTKHVFYFYNRALIKTEAYVSLSNFNQEFVWYYWDRRLIKKHSAFPFKDKNDESNLELADTLLNKYQKKK